MEFNNKSSHISENNNHDQVHEWFQEAASLAKIELDGFDPNASLSERISWATSRGFLIGSIYTRFSSKQQHSTADQIRTCVQYGASHGIYCPPEFVFCDEAVRGYKSRREGLGNLQDLLPSGRVHVVLVFKLSRLFRQAFKGYQWIQQEVVEMGLRAISVTQGIDTANHQSWKTLMQIHGMADDMMVEATADHVRAGLKGLFRRGYTVGALPVGYRRKVVPDAPLTNRSLPRTMPEIDHLGPHQTGETIDPVKPVVDVAAMIVRHYEMIRDGMSIREGWKRWVEEGGPADPRCPSGMMTYVGYRNMLSRRAYIGEWSYCRKRNVYLTRKDYSLGVLQPESEVLRQQSEHLRIMDDELFYAVQAVLATKGKGPRNRRKVQTRKLWDMVTDCFRCPYCQKRYYIAGPKNTAMTCKSGKLCPQRVIVNRKEAVTSVCRELCERILQDQTLLDDVTQQVLRSDQRDETELTRQRTVLEKRLADINRGISNLEALAETVSADDQTAWLNKIKARIVERDTIRKELALINRQIQKSSAAVTPELVRSTIQGFIQVFEEAADGSFGEEALNRAANLFRMLVGGQVWVMPQDRPGRKKKSIEGEFQVRLVQAVRCALDQVETETSQQCEPEKTRVWLRQPPRQEQVAERVHELIDIEKVSLRDAATILQSEGWKMNSGNVWYAYRRWYEMQGQTMPRNPYNNGHIRRKRGEDGGEMPMPPMMQT